MSTTAQYAAQPALDIAQVSAANTNRDGTGTTVLVASGPATAAGAGVGKRINRVTISRPGTSINTVVCFYVSFDGGATKRLISEWNVPAYSASTTTPQATVYALDLAGYVLPGSTGGIAVQLYASTQVATTLNIIVESGLL
jgi:hypothetical protein